MPLSFREIKTAAFTVPFLLLLLFVLLPPSLRPFLFLPPTRGTKMRTNQYSPTYSPRDHNLENERNPWKNGSVPSFVPSNGPSLCYYEWESSNETRRGQRKSSVNLCDFSTPTGGKVFRAKNLHAFPHLESFGALRGITYRLVSLFSHLTFGHRAKQAELSYENLSYDFEYKERGYRERVSKEGEIYLDERRKYYPPTEEQTQLSSANIRDDLFTRVK